MKRCATLLLAPLLLFAALARAEVPGERQPEAATGLAPKPAVYAKRFMAVTANRHASEAAVAVLKAGGSAADAAVAAQLILNLVEPQSSGLGGGGFLLYWDAKAKRLHAYDGREAAPAGADPRMFLGPGGKPLPFMEAVRSGKAVGVPGIPALLALVHAKHGRKPWAELLAPAIALAERGFAVSPRLAALVAGTPTLKARPETRAYFFAGGDDPVAPGTVLRNPAFAASLKLLEAGPAAFYRGPLGAAIAARVQAEGGTLAAADLAAYAVKEREPVCGAYIGFRVCGMGPPSSGGIAVLQILAMLERFPNETVAAENEKAAHLFAEATRLAFADRNLYVADPDFVRVPVKGLVDPAYLMARAALIDPAKAMDKAEAGTPPMDKGENLAPDRGIEVPGTSHLAIVDAEGNAVAFTTTIENGFGAQMMAGGFLLNNELTDFSPEPERDGKPIANRVAPGKRPRSSMAPTMVFDPQGRLVLVVGSPGG
ncbi:MAG: gamma-glutamyltransferase, partial [Rhodospirillaceae bacterium]|nr:gamma-glutamyltransferase [Rhodospirillaceae bacterium]